MGVGTYCFDVDVFAQDEFSVTAFLEDCRTRSPMETIHQDLKEFQTTLENQLVAIINKDYTEFLQLSSRLKGVDEAVASVRSPLQAILKRVDQVQHVVLKLQQKIHGQVQHDQELRKAEQDLELSIQISEKILLLEQLLDITVFDSEDEGDARVSARHNQPEQDEEEEEDDGFDNFEEVSRSLKERSAAETCAALERATQLLLQLDLEFLEGVDIPTVQREEKRLAVIEDTLLRRLETEFATEIFPDTFYNRDHSINATALSYLLRSYVLLQKTHVPEEMIARLLVHPFAEENITRGKIDGRVRGSCEGLQSVYEEILEFVSNKFKHILSLSVCQGETKSSVDILGNAVWKPLYEILSTKHAVIFKTADAGRFHTNYTISMGFLTAMEQFCGSEAMKLRFRTHESVLEFKEKWNMDVYFQLRYNQLSAAVDQSFGGKRDESIPDLSHEPVMLFPNTRALWEAVSSCWAKRVFLDPLLPDFMKLCLQLLVHYVSIWKAPIQEAAAQVGHSAKSSALSTHLACLAVEDDILCAGNDFRMLQKKIVKELFPVMAERLGSFADDNAEFVSELYNETLESLSELESLCWSAAAFVVAEECKKVLPALRTVKGQYQMTNKSAPTAPSTYVSNIIRPLDDFLERWGCHFVGDRKDEFLRSILDSVCELYYSLSYELLKSAQELEESLKSRKMQRNLMSSSDGLSDTEKMRLQLRLDLEELQRLVQKQGFALETCPAFALLHQSLT